MPAWMELFGGTPITVHGDVNALSDANAKVLERNELAAAIMAECGIPLDDLYSVVVGRPELRSTDGYHYNAAGYEVLAKAVADAIVAALE